MPSMKGLQLNCFDIIMIQEPEITDNEAITLGYFSKKRGRKLTILLILVTLTLLEYGFVFIKL
jgi:hypothetical protein